MGRMAIESFPSSSVSTTGRLTTASVSRMATCGWLITGVAMIEPCPPGEVLDAGGEALDRQLLRVADDRHDEAALAERDGDPEVHAVVRGDGAVLERGVQRRVLAQGVDRRA